jgi:hypothetical protein
VCTFVYACACMYERVKMMQNTFLGCGTDFTEQFLRVELSVDDEVFAIIWWNSGLNCAGRGGCRKTEFLKYVSSDREFGHGRLLWKLFIVRECILLNGWCRICKFKTRKFFAVLDELQLV